MENLTQEGVEKASQRPKGIKTADVKRLKREGHSVPAICNKLGVSVATVHYHLNKRRAKPTVKGAINPTPVDSTVSFEAELFGTLIVLDQVPSSIERVGNRITIK